jgi:hypothetical protein
MLKKMTKVFLIIFLSSLFLSTNSFSQSSDLIHFKCIIKESYRNSVKTNITIKEQYFTINRKEGWGKLIAFKDDKEKITTVNRKMLIQPSPYEEDNRKYISIGQINFRFGKDDEPYLYYTLVRFDLKNGEMLDENNLVISNKKNIVNTDIADCVREKKEFGK